MGKICLNHETAKEGILKVIQNDRRDALFYLVVWRLTMFPEKIVWEGVSRD